MKPLKPAPAFSTTVGPYQVAWAARGTRASGGSATLTLALAGTPYGGWLYLSGRDDPAGPDPHFPDGDGAVRVAITDGEGTKRVVGIVPVTYRAGSDFVSRLDIGAYLSSGRNVIAVSGFDLNVPEGVFAYAVFDGGGDAPPSIVQVVDGADLAHHAAVPPDGPDSELASFLVDPSGATRTGRVLLAAAGGDAAGGDEIFMISGLGGRVEGLRDSDGDGLPDIVNRRVPLTAVDAPPGGVDAANATGAPEARRRATSVAEDALGVPRAEGGLGCGAGLSVLDAGYELPGGHTHVNFQVQSEDPEDGDAVKLLVAVNWITIEGVNPSPDIDVVKDAAPAELPEGGGTATFTIAVNNTGGEAITLTALADDVFGDLAGVGTCAAPVVVPIGGSYGCSFEALVSGTHDIPHRDVVTAFATGRVSGLPAQASDDAVLTFAPHRDSSLAGRVWRDGDRDGVLEAGEAGIDGVGVLLRDVAGRIVATTSTAPSAGASGAYLFADLEMGAYVVEVVPPPLTQPTWDFDGAGTPHRASCFVNEDQGLQAVSFGYAPVPGRVVVVKRTDLTPTDARFAFVASYAPEGFTLGSGERHESGDLDPGTYSVSEFMASGWNTVSALCDDGNRPAAISVEAGETVTCAFTSAVARGHILVRAVTIPEGAPGEFLFDATWDPAGFSLRAGETVESPALIPGVHAVRQIASVGWALVAASCDGGTSPDAVTVGIAQTVTCTFVNLRVDDASLR